MVNLHSTQLQFEHSEIKSYIYRPESVLKRKSYRLHNFYRMTRKSRNENIQKLDFSSTLPHTNFKKKQKLLCNNTVYF